MKKRRVDNSILLTNNIEFNKESNHNLLRDHFIKPTKKPYKILNLRCNRRLNPTDEEELNQIINKLNNDKAAGPDQIPNKLIKIIYKSDKEYFVKLFNKILMHVELPVNWKEGELIYFLKPNKKGNQPTDYRPITLINCLCKIAEKLMIYRIDNELNKRDFY